MKVSAKPHQARGNEIKDFKIVYEKDKVWGDYLKCNHCGERVERGIVPVSNHWMRCLKRKEGLIIIKKNDRQDN